MHYVLDFFSLKDVLPLILLIWLLHFVATRISDSSAIRLCARGLAAAGFFSFAGFAIAELEPVTPWDFLCLSLRALLAMGTTHGLAVVALPVARFVYMRAWGTPLKRCRTRAEQRAREAEIQERERETAERNRAEQERKAEEQRRRQEKIVNRPPPLNREQRMTISRQRYDAILGMLASAGLEETELQAARERAKQQYLRELDEAMR